MQCLRFLWRFIFGGDTGPLNPRLEESLARIAELEKQAAADRASYKQDLGNLQARIKDQEAQVLDLERSIDALQREVTAQKAIIAERESTIAALRASLKSGEAAAPVDSSVTPRPEEKAGEPQVSEPSGATGVLGPEAGFISRFIVSARDPAFDASPGAPLNAVRNALEIAPLLRMVETSADKKAPTLVKQLKKHEEGLLKLRDSLSQKLAAGEEAPVETIAGEYFGIFQRIFLNNILLAAYRGLKNGNPMYARLVAPLTDYLATCGFSTRDVVPGREIRDEDYEDMHVYLKKTACPELDNVIFEVERLPYYLRYLNEEGEEMSLCCQGALTLYKREQ